MADTDALAEARAGLAAAQERGDARSIAYYEHAIDRIESPPPLPGRLATGARLSEILKAEGWAAAWATALAAQSRETVRWWDSGYRDLIPENAVKLVRIAAACRPPVDLKALFDAALADA